MTLWDFVIESMSAFLSNVLLRKGFYYPVTLILFFIAGSVIKGWDQGVATMLKGEKSLLTCKPDFAYGEKGSPPKIPPNSTLQFEVELLSWKGNDISGDGGVVMNVLQKGSDSDYYRPKDGAEVEGGLL